MTPTPDIAQAEADAFMTRIGELALAAAGGLVMAFLGASAGAWLNPGLNPY